ncbi:uncharacterized protein LY79DRAFT_403320 [Colletotrichum navitas]|uniref:Uncharacterized protein n=1 Tax=Colletotrichum navitas TaxID=681940 RepID=A0AAD8VA37_9PEZI|nr:uncharacterized protein LY79DRAFT_403320 [Colletotrichum navitas]KAK1597050.1 hypothetical protein LY79DRAFT_403320 [Colletotrichum navitas]
MMPITTITNASTTGLLQQQQQQETQNKNKNKNMSTAGRTTGVDYLLHVTTTTTTTTTLMICTGRLSLAAALLAPQTERPDAETTTFLDTPPPLSIGHMLRTCASRVPVRSQPACLPVCLRFALCCSGSTSLSSFQLFSCHPLQSLQTPTTLPHSTVLSLPPRDRRRVVACFIVRHSRTDVGRK